MISKEVYLNDELDYIVGNIVEWDMKSAGFSILKSKKYFSKSQLDKLNNMNKNDRKIHIGLMSLRDPIIKDILHDGFEEYRLKFMELNEIKDNNIISIKKDAIFVINTKIKHTKFDEVVFDSKNQYTTFVKLGKIEFYYSDFDESYDIKGISDDMLKYHKKIINEIIHVIKMIERNDFNSARIYLYKLSNKYRKYECDKKLYREFNAESKYRLNYTIEGYSLGIDEIDDKSILDITYNYNMVIMSLLRMVL